MVKVSKLPGNLTIQTSCTRGFTLIEVLLAISLLSLLMLSAVTAYDFMQQNWQRSKASQQASMHHYTQWQLVFDVLINTYPKLVQQRAEASPAGFYFLGRDNGYTAVSATSVQQPGVASVYRLFKEPDPAVAGFWQLVYEEALLTEQLLVYAEQELPFAFRRVLLSEQSSIDFRYQGWPSLQQKRLAESNDTGAQSSSPWVGQYDGMQTMLQPEQLQIISDHWNWQQRFDASGDAQLAQLDAGL